MTQPGMFKFTEDLHRCTRCGHTYLARRKRAWWMKLIGVAQYLRCSLCCQRLLYRPPDKGTPRFSKPNS